MSYTIKFQKPASYQNTKYGSGTIGSSACGCASLCNCLVNAGIADVSVPTMCNLAVSCGARVSGGTVELTLLKAAAPKYNFTYTTTSKNTDLLAHLKAGGTAICYCGGNYSLFSNGGHYVAAIGLSGDRIVVADSLYYSGKWSANSTRKSQIKTTGQQGIVTVTLTALGKATADRSPSYFLIHKKVPTVTPVTKTVSIITETLNIRSGAGTTYSILGTLKSGSIVNVVGTTGSWYKIKYGSGYGYISTQYTKDYVEDTELVTDVKIKINGHDVTVKSILKDNRNYVQLAQLGELLGLTIGYTNNTPTIDFAKLNMQIDGQDMQISGGSFVPGTSYAVVRELATALGKTVDWNAETKSIIIK